MIVLSDGLKTDFSVPPPGREEMSEGLLQESSTGQTVLCGLAQAGHVDLGTDRPVRSGLLCPPGRS